MTTSCARNVNRITLNASCRLADTRAEEISRPLPDLPGALPVQAPIAAVAIENQSLAFFKDTHQVLRSSGPHRDSTFKHLSI